MEVSSAGLGGLGGMSSEAWIVNDSKPSLVVNSPDSKSIQIMVINYHIIMVGDLLYQDLSASITPKVKTSRQWPFLIAQLEDPESKDQTFTHQMHVHYRFD